MGVWPKVLYISSGHNSSLVMLTTTQTTLKFSVTQFADLMDNIVDMYMYVQI